jgi:hypothetical protein
MLVPSVTERTTTPMISNPHIDSIRLPGSFRVLPCPHLFEYQTNVVLIRNTAQGYIVVAILWMHVGRGQKALLVCMMAAKPFFKYCLPLRVSRKVGTRRSFKMVGALCGLTKPRMVADFKSLAKGLTRRNTATGTSLSLVYIVMTKTAAVSPQWTLYTFWRNWSMTSLKWRKRIGSGGTSKVSDQQQFRSIDQGLEPFSNVLWIFRIRNLAILKKM